MFLWKVTHEYRLLNHLERKYIGIYSSLESSKEAIENLKTKNGFNDTLSGFKIKKIFRLTKPKSLNNTNWIDGFESYMYVKNINKKIVCDKTLSILKKFGFLVKEYGFEFDKLALGDLKDYDGKLLFYGPFNCYSFYKNGISINFMNLVQKGDWDITITKEFCENQNYLKTGQKIDSKYCYNWDLLLEKIKYDLETKKEIFGNRV